MYTRKRPRAFRSLCRLLFSFPLPWYKEEIRVSRSSARIVFPAISRDRCSKVTVVDLCARRSIEKVNRRIYRVREKMTSLGITQSVVPFSQQRLNRTPIIFRQELVLQKFSFLPSNLISLFFYNKLNFNARYFRYSSYSLRVKRNVSFST